MMLILLLITLVIRFYPADYIQRGSLLWYVRSGNWQRMTIEANAMVMLREAQVYLPLKPEIQVYDAK